MVISDLTFLNTKHFDVIKRLLGRDSFTKEEKYKSEIGTINSYCQVLIISNLPPKAFDFFKNDQTVLDKLIPVYLGP